MPRAVSMLTNAALLAFSHMAAMAGELTLPAWVGDHMVLPSNRAFTLSGSAEPGADVSVVFAGKQSRTKADAAGAWSLVVAPAQDVRTHDALVVSATAKSDMQTRTFRDVALGDTWLCSGQSNMAFIVEKSAEAKDAAVGIGAVDVRYFDGKSWRRLTPSTVKKVSAVAVHFATEMARRQKRPVGIFVAARGGTGIESWMPADAFPDTADGARMRRLADDPSVLKAAAEDAVDFRPFGRHRLARWKLGRAAPAGLYEQFLRPFGDLPIRGVLWYQGETNIGSEEYDLWLIRLIASWRSHWKQPDLLFGVIQLPAFDPGTEADRAGWARIQAAQAAVSSKTPFTAMVDIKDLGELRNIHPRKKQDVGKRAVDMLYPLVQKE